MRSEQKTLAPPPHDEKHHESDSFMKKKIEPIFIGVKEKVPLGDAYTPGPNKEENTNKIRFAHALQDAAFHSTIITEITNNVEQMELFKTILSGLCTELYGCGNCGGRTSLAALDFMRSKSVDMSIEIIHLDGENEKKRGFNHCLLVINRNVKESNLQEPETWRGVTLFDTWTPTEKLQEHAPSSAPTKGMLTAKDKKSKPLLVDDSVSILSTLRIEKNLSRDQWKDVVKFLEGMKKFLTEKTLANLLEKSGRKNVDITNELELIHKKITSEIDSIMKFKLSPIALLNKLFRPSKALSPKRQKITSETPHFH